MLSTDLMGLVEHVRPPRLDLRNAEIETILANQDSLRATLPFSASDTAKSTERWHLSDEGVEQEVLHLRKQVRTTAPYCVVRMFGKTAQIWKVQNPTPSLGAVTREEST